jgi:hypothetical protein
MSPCHCTRLPLEHFNDGAVLRLAGDKRAIGSQPLGAKQGNMLASQLQLRLFAWFGLIGNDNESTTRISLHHSPPKDHSNMHTTLLA